MTEARQGFPPVVGAAGLVVLFVFGLAALPRVFAPRESERVGKEAPAFSVRVVANEAALAGASSLALADLRGRPVVLDFWATWCGPCQAEAPIVNKLAQRYKERGLVVVGVNTSDQEGRARGWALSHGLSFPIVYDANDAVAHAYGVENLPTLVVVSRTGKILAMRTGVTDDAELEALVRQAL